MRIRDQHSLSKRADLASRAFWRTLPVLVAFILPSGLLAEERTAGSTDPWTLDFRYAPPDWQTAICLPDDWQKSLVGKDGTLLYDYGGKRGGFGTRIRFGLAGELAWDKQALLSPRVPIVRTFEHSGDLQVLQETFAVAPPLKNPKGNSELRLERVGKNSVMTGWASPPGSVERAFANIAVGWKEPVRYRFKAARGQKYYVAFGLCEGFHERPGQRILTVSIEHRAMRTLDLVAEKGRNQPEILVFPARDENGDGWIDLEVAAAGNSPDKNAFLNALWIFNGKERPNPQELLTASNPLEPLAHLDCSETLPADNGTRHDVIMVSIRNTGSREARFVPVLTVESDSGISAEPSRRCLRIGGGTALECSQQFALEETAPGKNLLQFPEQCIPPGSAISLSFGVVRGKGALLNHALKLAETPALRRKAERYWRNLNLPYDRLQVPDLAVESLLDSSIRNIYQAREIKDGLPAFQVGPTCYRGLWVVDGSFLLEAMTYLGRSDETRSGIKYLMSFQRPDGAFMLIDGHWKETGIALWAISRHARLTGDKAWLKKAWPGVKRGVAFIRSMRGMPAADALNARLVPDGFSDGGLAGKVPEYTNIYWTMAGLRAAIEAARWLGSDAEANDWQAEYDDFVQTFRRAAQRDLRKDFHGNSYLPIRMQFDEKIPPQKAQWAFLHSIFPGKVFSAEDPLVRGNMSMLMSAESEGQVLDTGWLKDGIWTYFGSFFAHAWLWLGESDKASRTLYAFGNHASPLMAWREEQMPSGHGTAVVGDMPHNWASAEFIRLVRHSLILERGNGLHLFEAVPAAWIKPGARIQGKDIATEFGPVSFEFRVSSDGSAGTLKLNPPRRNPAKEIILHLDHWSGRKGSQALPADHRSFTTIPLARI